jgi:hypothetical protein
MNGSGPIQTTLGRIRRTLSLSPCQMSESHLSESPPGPTPDFPYSKDLKLWEICGVGPELGLGLSAFHHSQSGGPSTPKTVGWAPPGSS